VLCHRLSIYKFAKRTPGSSDSVPVNGKLCSRGVYVAVIITMCLSR